MNKTEQTFTVSEINRRVKQILEGGLSSIAVEGELSNVKAHTSGHLYFTLKDDYAQIAGVMWRSRAAALSFLPEDGMHVVVTGRVTVYEVRGIYQIDAFSIRPLGIGDLQAAFDRLKQKLAAEGLFALERKRPLPPFPGRIGIITSPTGAVLHDMLNVFRRRFPGIELVLSPARVQGEGAAEEITQALQDMNSFGEVDVIILARGGGSLEDLWPFNEERVARAIAASTIPVISAVGHEVDVTISDFVADLRAPTPTAAAEVVVKDRGTLLDILRNSWYRIDHSVASMLQSRRKHIYHLLQSYAFNKPVDLLHRHSQHLDELTRALSTHVLHSRSLAGARVQALADRLRALDPAVALRRGFAIVRKDGHVVTTTQRLHSRDAISVQFSDGSIDATVE